MKDNIKYEKYENNIKLYLQIDNEKFDIKYERNEMPISC